MLNFVGSVCAPDNATLKAENHALQCTTAGSVCGLGPDLVGIRSSALRPATGLQHARPRKAEV